MFRTFSVFLSIVFLSVEQNTKITQSFSKTSIQENVNVNSTFSLEVSKLVKYKAFTILTWSHNAVAVKNTQKFT